MKAYITQSDRGGEEGARERERGTGIYIYIYIYIEREREGGGGGDLFVIRRCSGRDREGKSFNFHLSYVGAVVEVGS